MPTFDTLFNNPTLLLMLCFASFIIGLSKGGLPAVAMLSVPILSLSMSPLTAAALLLPIYILSDAVGVWLYRREFSAVNLRTLIPAGILGVLIGWATAAYISDAAVSLLIGVMGVSFCLFTWLRDKSKVQVKSPSVGKGLFWGTLSGFTSFVAHAGAPPFQIYTLPQQLPKMVFAGTTTIVFAIVNLAKIIPYSYLQPYTLSSLQVSATLLPIAALGTVIGRQLIKKMPEKWFFLAVQVALFLISIRLIIGSI